MAPLDSNGQPPKDDGVDHSVVMHQTLSGEHALPPDVEPQDVLEILAQKVAAKVGSGNGNGGPPHRRFLGLELGAWTKLILGWSIAAGIFLLTWYNTVNANMKERPTREEIVKTLMVHAEESHPGAADKADLKAVDVKVQAIEVEQRVQSTQLKGIGKDIGEIKDDMKHLRRRRNRGR